MCACGIADGGHGALKVFDGESHPRPHCQGHTVAVDPDLQQLWVSPAGLGDLSAFAVSAGDLLGGRKAAAFRQALPVGPCP